jgi:hypothetical protein
MAVWALSLSVFSFVLPLGLIALVLAHISRRRILRSNRSLEGASVAKAAMLIGYIQVLLVVGLGVLMFREYASARTDFMNDSKVREVYRETEKGQLSDAQVEAERREVVSLMEELKSLEDRNLRFKNAYGCSLLEIGSELEGFTQDEARSLSTRFAHSKYIFEVRDCDKNPDSPAYSIVAFPRLFLNPSPSLREKATTYCTDQSSGIKYVVGGISLDCFDHGTPVSSESAGGN